MLGKSNITSTAELSSCFIDTGVFFAALNDNDQMHDEAALLLMASVMGWFGKAYTSTYVVDEALTLTKSRISGKEAVRLADDLSKSKKIAILKVEEKDGLLQESMELFRKNVDERGLSFTDCTTTALLKRTNIECLLSFDNNFRPFTKKFFGDGFSKSLSKDQTRLLASTITKLGIKAKIIL